MIIQLLNVFNKIIIKYLKNKKVYRFYLIINIYFLNIINKIIIII